MLRLLVLLLALANALFFAYSRGWLGAPAAQREPQRLQAQLAPERVQLLNGGAASAALAGAAKAAAESAPQCVEAGPFAESQIVAAEAALQQARLPSGAWARNTQETAGSAWLVYMGRYANNAQLQAKIEELRRISGLVYEEIKEPPGLVPGLSLGRYADEAGAKAALEALAKRGVRSAKLQAVGAPVKQHWLRVPRSDAALRAQLVPLKAGTPALSFVACKAP